MKINPYQSIQQNLFRKQLEKHDKTAESKAKSDKLEISSEALEMQKGTPIEKERQAKVEELKQKIEDGEYKVNPQAVANKFYQFWNE